MIRETAAERFWSKVEQIPFHECWEWSGSHNHMGYAKFQYMWAEIRAARFAYELLVGPIPPGLHIDHLCRNRGCVRPDHMEPVSNRENVLRGVGPSAINAAKTHCVHGHPFSAENTRITLRRGIPRRACRTCTRARGRGASGPTTSEER